MFRKLRTACLALTLAASLTACGTPDKPTLIVEHMVIKVLPPDGLLADVAPPPPRAVADTKGLLGLTNEFKAALDVCRGNLAELRTWKESEK